MGVEQLGLLEGLFAVGGLPDDLKVGLGLEHLRQRLADQGMIIGDQNSDAIHLRAPWGWAGRRAARSLLRAQSEARNSRPS